jgi:hypothetical protein
VPGQPLNNFKKIVGMKKEKFKPYKQNRPILLPSSLGKLIPEGHLAQAVNEMIKQLHMAPLM